MGQFHDLICGTLLKVTAKREESNDEWVLNGSLPMVYSSWVLGETRTDISDHWLHSEFELYTRAESGFTPHPVSFRDATLTNCF